MFSYHAYGLAIQSTLSLSEFCDRETEPDVVVHWGKVNLSPSVTDGAQRYLCGTGEEVYLYWKDIGTFLVRNGREIIIDPAPGVKEPVLRSIVLGAPLGVLLHQRGLSIFHASAIAFREDAVAFMAHKGHGKSTIAAALNVRKHNLVTDDIMAFEEKNGQLLVSPGFPQLKLWPDSVEAIGESLEGLPLLRPSLEKRVRQISQGFALKPLPLRCVFVLCGSQKLEIVRLQPKDSLLKILPHWYGALFQGELLKIFGLDNHLHQCVNLVQKVPVFLLKGPPSLPALPNVARMVEEHLMGREENSFLI